MKRIVLILSGLLLLPAAVSMAEPGGPLGPGLRHGKNPQAMMERHLEKLGLEPAQEARVREILTSSRQAREENGKQMRAAFREMRELLDEETPNEAAVMRQAEKMGSLKTEGHKAMLRTLLAVRAELTPEQREKLKEMKHSRRKGFLRDKRRGEGESGE